MRIKAGTVQTEDRQELAFVAGSGITLSASDDNTSGASVTITSTGTGIHGATHGIGGTDPLTAGLVVGNGDPTNGPNDLFSDLPRIDLAFPVSVRKPSGASASYNYAQDFAPKGSPGNFSSNGICWMDICGIDPTTTANLNAARIGVYTDHVEYGSRKFGTNPAIPLWIGCEMDGLVGTAQIRLNQALIVIGAETTVTASSIVLGSGVALATSFTSGTVEIPSCAGTPTGAYSTHGAAVPMVADTTGSKIWFRIGGAWKGVVVA